MYPPEFKDLVRTIWSLIRPSVIGFYFFFGVKEGGWVVCVHFFLVGGGGYMSNSKPGHPFPQKNLQEAQ